MEAKDRLVKCEDSCPDAGTPRCNDCDYGAAFEEGAAAQDEISFPLGMQEGKKVGRDEEAEGLRKVIDFAYGVAKVMDDLKSSHIFFILQQAFGSDMEWDDIQEILTTTIEKSKAKLQEWGIKED